MPRAHRAPQRSRFSTWRWPNSFSTKCANFTRLLATVWAARNRKWRNVGTMATDKQTNKQTDAPSLNSYLDCIPHSRLSPHLRKTTGRAGPWQLMAANVGDMYIHCNMKICCCFLLYCFIDDYYFRNSQHTMHSS